MKLFQFLIIVFIFSSRSISSQDMKYIDSLLIAYDRSAVDTTKIGILSFLSEAWYASNPEKSIGFNKKIISMADKALPLYNETGQKRVFMMKAAALNNLGILALDKGEVMTGVEYYKESIPMFEKAGNKDYLANAYNNIAFVYESQGDITRGLEYYFKSLKLREEIGDKRGIAESYNNIAFMYNGQQDKDKALSTFNKALKLFEEAGDENGIGLVYNNIGNIYKQTSQYDKALHVLFKSAVIKSALRDHKGLSTIYLNIGDVHQKQKRFDSAKYYFDASLKEAQVAQNKSRVASAVLNLALLSLECGDSRKALAYAKESLNLSLQLGFPEKIRDSYSILTKVYATQRDYKGAYESLRSYKVMADSILSDATKQDAVKHQMKYTFDKRELEVVKEKEKSEFEHQVEVNRQSQIIFTSIGVLLIVIVFSIFLYKRYILTKHQKSIIEEQKTIVERQKFEVEQQKLLVEEHQKEIIDSITYAKRLQQAILPSNEELQKYLPESFLLYKPKDIVAGDFYWMEHLDETTYIAAADSTGHGVPGAMVSVVCSNAMNRAVKEFGLRVTGKILDKTRELVLETFAKSGEEIKDGMDVSLLAIDKNKEQISWSGANNQLWYISNNELKEITADKQPIGKNDDPKPFSTNGIKFKKGDTYYLMTDGYPDQFGGPKGKKFKYKQLEQLLLSICNQPLHVQSEILNLKFKEWIGNLEQVDDVTIIGVRV